MSTSLARDNEFTFLHASISIRPRNNKDEFLKNYQVTLPGEQAKFVQQIDQSFFKMVLESANSIESKTNNQNSGLIERFWNLVLEFLTKHDSKVKYLTRILIAIVYNSFFVAATYHHWANRLEIDWCGGVGLLIVLTVITYATLFYYKIFKPKFGKRIFTNVLAPLSKLLDKYWNIW